MGQSSAASSVGLSAFRTPTQRVPSETRPARGFRCLTGGFGDIGQGRVNCVGIEHTVWSTGVVTITTAERSEVRGRAQTRPAARPSRAFRAFVGLLAVGAGLFNVALMLSDRAPALTERIFGDFAGRLTDRLNRSEQIGSLTEGRNPGNDAIVHIGVWFVAMVLVGLAIWRWAPLIIAAVLLFAGSVLIEIGQGRYSSTRNVEMSDVFANGAGVTLGVVASAACYLTWSGFSSAGARVRNN